MNNEENVRLEIEEPVPVQIEQVISTQKTCICSWCRRLFNFDDEPNQNHHRPVFIIVMCILHVSIHLLTYIDIRWNGDYFGPTLGELGMFFVPCMRSTPDYIRIRNVRCGIFSRNLICSYDDELKRFCSSFMYPYQWWRLITVNLLHMRAYHLLHNIFTQCLYGIPLEYKYGSARIFVIYWLSELGSSLSAMVINPEKPSVGASGSLYGLRLFFVVDRLVGIQKNPNRRLLIVVQLAILVLTPFLLTCFIIFFFDLDAVHSAHFGGGLTGFLCGVYMLGCPCPCIREHCISRTICRRLALALLSLYFVTALTIFLLNDVPDVASIF